MSFPTDPGFSTLSKANLDSGSDKPSDGRAEIEALVDRVNALSTLVTNMINHGVPVVQTATSQTITGSLTVTGDIIGKSDVKAFQP